MSHQVLPQKGSIVTLLPPKRTLQAEERCQQTLCQHGCQLVKWHSLTAVTNDSPSLTGMKPHMLWIAWKPNMSWLSSSIFFKLTCWAIALSRAPVCIISGRTWFFVKLTAKNFLILSSSLSEAFPNLVLFCPHPQYFWHYFYAQPDNFCQSPQCRHCQLFCYRNSVRNRTKFNAHRFIHESSSLSHKWKDLADHTQLNVSPG